MLQQIAAADASAWESLALSQNSAQGLLFTYGSTNSWALTYNLYADLLLQTNVVSQSVSNCSSGSEPDVEVSCLGVRSSRRLLLRPHFRWDV